MPPFIAKFIASKFAIPVMYGAAIVFLILIFSTMRGCDKRAADRRVAAQADQGNASAEALAKSAALAVNAVDERYTAEQAIDVATNTARQDMSHAQDPDAIRRAVTDALCVRPQYRNDPGCVVRGPDPR